MSDKSGALIEIDFAGALFITLMVLKLTKVIDWSWWWITAPLWGSAALVLAFAVLVGIIWLLATASVEVGTWWGRRRARRSRR